MKSVKSVAHQLHSWIAENATDKPSGWEGIFCKQPTYTTDQIKRHDHADDGWVLDHKTRKIYCITPMLSGDFFSHPHSKSDQMRGQLCRRLGGGIDVHVDLENHRGSRQQQLWDAMYIGKLAAGEPLPEPPTEQPNMRSTP